MKNHPKGLGRPGRSIALFVVALWLFNWPLLSIAHDSGPAALFGYLFVGWLTVIGLTFFISRHIDTSPTVAPRDPGDDDV